MTSARAAEFVIDASVAAAPIHGHVRAGAYRQWLIQTYREGARLSAPSLIRYELASVVFKHVPAASLRSDPGLVIEHVRDATLGIDLDEDAWTRCGRLAGTLSAYDACYLAMAVQREATLVTFDTKLARAAAPLVPVLTEQDFR